MACSMIKWAHGVVHGSTSAEYHCECGARVCVGLLRTLEDCREPETCPNCDALLDWSELIG